MSFSSPRDCPPRYSTPRTESRRTLGTAAANIAEKLGVPLMPWQRLVMDTALEIENGQFAYREVILTIPRQCGKSTLMLVLILTRALMTNNQRIVFTAQTRADARKMWAETWMPMLETSGFAEHFKTRMANGDESLIFDNGSRQGLVASTLKAGHGQTLDMAIVDEAFAQADARLEQALKPTMLTRSKLPHRGPQFWVVSTAGTLNKSPYLWNKVENGRVLAEENYNNSVAYFEWSASDDEDPSDEETWLRCMPALGRTVDIQAVKSDFMSMDLHEFERAMLNRWTTAKTDPVIPLDVWNELADKELNTRGIPVVLAVDVTPLREASSVAASGVLEDGRTFVEVIAHREGTEWVPGLVEKLINSNDVSRVIVDPTGPAVSLVDPLQRLGVNFDGGMGIKVANREMSEAWSTFYDAVVEADKESPAFVHSGQHDVQIALDGAVKRPVGDGGWAWGRKHSAVDISPLVAITLAFWGARGSQAGEVWSLDEIVGKLRAERAGQEIGTVQEQPPSVPAGNGALYEVVPI